MRIAWFTPFHMSSAIGRFSRLVTAEIAKSAEVDIWHPPTDATHPTELRIISIPDDVALGEQMLASYDLCVYNLGDHLEFHGRIFETSRRVPGIVVLHDFVMHHFFAAYYLLERKSPQEYLAAMDRAYGAAGRRAAEPVVAGTAPGVWESDRVMEFPFFEDAIRGACGVMVHSEFMRDAVAKVFPGPSRAQFLAYDTHIGKRPPLSRKDLQLPNDKLVVLTIGHANSNKRILEVIEAIGKSRRLSGQVIYAVLGFCQGPYESMIRQTIGKFGLEEAVRLMGQVSDDVLCAYLMHADVCVNLRNPAMEGASASAIEEMLHGKPVIVTNSGFYRQLPSDAVFKVEPGEEVRGVSEILARLAGDAPLRRRVGDQAKRFASEQARPDRYAAALLEFANELRDAMPILKFSRRVAVQLAGMEVTRDMPLISRVADSTYELFCANGRELKSLPE
jgi:glycosyltransferase involved in cell wall biosynthesis